MAPRQRRQRRTRKDATESPTQRAKLTAAEARTRRQVDRLVADHLKLARTIAEVRAARLPRWVVFDDVLSDAMKGVFDAARRFQPARGVAFAVYASWRIRGAIDDGLRDRDFLSRSHRAGLKRRGADAPGMMSLSMVIGHNAEGEPVELVDDLPAGGRGPAQHRLDGDIIREHFQAVCRGLGAKVRLILTLRYVDGLSMANVGHIVGLSESRISQIHAAALLRLGRMINRSSNPPPRQRTTP